MRMKVFLTSQPQYVVDSSSGSFRGEAGPLHDEGFDESTWFTEM